MQSFGKTVAAAYRHLAHHHNGRILTSMPRNLLERGLNGTQIAAVVVVDRSVKCKENEIGARQRFVSRLDKHKSSFVCLFGHQLWKEVQNAPDARTARTLAKAFFARQEDAGEHLA